MSATTEAPAAITARDRILFTAHDLFYRDGVRATGIDRIIAEAGVAKLTFYRHFASKDLLITAFLEYRHERWMAWFTVALARHGAKPGGGFLPLIDVMDEWFREPLFRGCAFINAVAEMGAVLPEVVEISKRHKRDMLQVIADLAPAQTSQTETASAAALAIDGAIVRAQMDGAEAALDGLRCVLAALQAGLLVALPVQGQQIT
jgi:AcrR family transcriptional regulator